MTTTIRFTKNDFEDSVRKDRFETFKAGVKVVAVAIIASVCFVAYMYTLQNLPIDQIAFKLIGK